MKKVVSEVRYFWQLLYTQMGVYKLALDYLSGRWSTRKNRRRRRDCFDIEQTSEYLCKHVGFPKALGMHSDALRYFEKSGNKNGQANCLINIGNHYLAQSDDKEALEATKRRKSMRT